MMDLKKPSSTPLIEMRGISKSFGGVRANADVELVLGAGEILGLLGENGAGKTTLMNILFGVYQADHGTIAVEGKPVRIQSAADALAAGIGMVHQHFHLAPRLSVLDNLLVGLPGKSGRLDRAGGRCRPQAHRAAIRPGARSRPAGVGAVGRRAAAAGNHQGAVPRRAHPDPRRADGGADAGRDRRPVRGAAGHGRARVRHHLHLAQAQRGARADASLRGAAPRPRRGPCRRPQGDECGRDGAADVRPRDRAAGASRLDQGRRRAGACRRLDIRPCRHAAQARQPCRARRRDRRHRRRLRQRPEGAGRRDIGHACAERRQHHRARPCKSRASRPTR